MPERIIITMMVAGGLVLLWGAWQLYKPRLMQTITVSQTSTGRPQLLYFTGEYCAVCKHQQTPVVQQLRDQLGHAIDIATYDVSQHPELARQYRVLTLPTTVVLTGQGEVAHINYGIADEAKLACQLTQTL